MKKLLSLLICLALLTAAVPLGSVVSSAGGAAITCESAVCVPGEEVSVKVNISGNPGFSYLELTPQYSDRLTLVSVTNGSLVNDLTQGKQFVWSADEDVTGNGTLMTFVFRLADNASAGSYPVSFVFRSAINYNEEPVAFAVVPGAVTVASENAPVITCESVSCKAGEECTVKVDISDNPGFSYLELTPVFSEQLSLVGISNGSLVSELTQGKQYVWSADEDATGDGNLMSFRFKVAGNVQPGEYSVSFIFRSAVNYNEEAVQFTVVPGTVTVEAGGAPAGLKGDLNLDGEVDASDLTLLARHVAKIETVAGEALDNADVTGDGEVDASDLTMLARFVAKIIDKF